MGAVLDALLVLFIARAVWRLARGYMKMRTRAPSAPPSDHGIQMMRDPVCGTFVVPDRAVSLSDGHERVYFCSTACRDQYRAKSA